MSHHCYRQFVNGIPPSDYSHVRGERAGFASRSVRHSRSGKDLPVGGPKRIFARPEVLELCAPQLPCM